ncbi:hypothetical protein CcCBS67573_g05749 [Chytriomyces confervae]|uniref:Uncharacterized protein n=1 Tax=Chytriomyces confervae TaxID=246404 RepID=A0A507F8V5_9FUNG|nr:hypothetical protein HDU80_000608 [Chytriomyces hyalinus]TPX72574.1 hypothetical protein CcCBS67573_g05749 [Chytriomyces confervae]
MGFLGSVCNLVKALTILCELPPKPDAPAPELNGGLTAYFKSFNDADINSGASLPLMGNGLPLVYQPLFAYLVCVLVPGIAVMVLIITGRDQSQKWNLRPLKK